MLKRARDLYDTPCSSTPPHPPSKRAHTELTDSSPLAARSRSTFSTPFSYYSPRTPFSVPSDSPTNPFGLNRSLAALGLPPKTSFSKHITLRFQLIEHCTTTRPIRPRRVEKGGIYRVVQVPTNYSFRHLHKLILFLFASDIERLHKPRPAIPITARDRRVAAKNSARAVTREPGVSSSDPSSSHPSLEKWQGHSFEVLKQINIHSECTKPGIIKEGVTCAKLSSVRERRLFRDLFESSATALQASSSDIDEPDDDEEQSGWSWEAEDDYTLSYVWPRGPTLDKGIIYRHNQAVSIHITANTLPVPGRKGIGNKPYVFIAQGLAGNSIKIAYVTPNSRGGEGVTDSEDDEPSSMQKFKQVPITNWNTLDAFGKFLQLEGDREQALQGHVNPTSTSASVPQEAALPFRDSTPCASETESDGDMSLASDGFLFPFALSAITPYPSHPARRRRVEKAERRLEKLTRSGLSTMCSSDEEDPVRDPQRGTLDTSDDGDGRDKCEDWDPFGDEAEL